MCSNTMQKNEKGRQGPFLLFQHRHCHEHIGEALMCGARLRQVERIDENNFLLTRSTVREKHSKIEYGTLTRRVIPDMDLISSVDCFPILFADIETSRVILVRV